MHQDSNQIGSLGASLPKADGLPKIEALQEDPNEEVCAKKRKGCNMRQHHPQKIAKRNMNLRSVYKLRSLYIMNECWVCFLAIVNMCELVNCRPHGQTTRMTVKLAPKTCPEPSEPRTPTLKAITKDWTYQNKIIKRDTKTYYILSSIPFYHFSWRVKTSEKRRAQAAPLWYWGTRKPWKSLRSIFPWRLWVQMFADLMLQSLAHWERPIIAHLNRTSRYSIDGCHLAWFCSKIWTKSIYFLGLIMNHWNLDDFMMFNGSPGTWQDDDADIGEDVVGLRCLRHRGFWIQLSRSFLSISTFGIQMVIVI